MYHLIREIAGLIRYWDHPDPALRWVYLFGILFALALWLIPMWLRRRNAERATERTDSFYVVSKDPGYTAFAAGSSLTETFSPRARVCLRFYPRREGYHSDDNDIILNCSEDVYARLREGTYIRATWLGEELICFTQQDDPHVN